MLIGVDASRVTRVLTGTESYTLQVLSRLLAMDRENQYRLYLSAPLPVGLIPRAPSTETRLIRVPRLWTHVGLSAEMLRSAPDLLFVPSHVLPVITARRNVVVVYDAGHRIIPFAYTPAQRIYLEWSIRRHVRIATAIITISEASKRDLVRFYGANPDTIAVAYPAVDESFRPPAAGTIAEVRARYSLPDPYVLHVGTVKPNKNLVRLVHAFADAALPTDAALVLAGQPGPAWGAVQSAALERGLGKRLRLLSYVPAEDLPALYGGAACAAVVSLYEGFGMPALEALACGAPLVASDRGPLPEIVGDGALLLNPLDLAAISQALRVAVLDEAAASDLRRRGPVQAGRFTWDEAARVTLQTLNEAGR